MAAGPGSAAADAEGGGGDGSDFLALGWLLGVGPCDYRGWDRDNEVSGETLESSGAQRILHNPSLEGGPWVATALQQAAQPFLSCHVGG